ncbi:hypothetical protein [Sorangium sp. So ce233]|uniref:hypothetical protein n=1 Tax=Sorangium sp. So ce233 TaxID=3133290 RepID=UPI003F63F2BA
MMVHGSTPDLWRASGSHGAAVYFDMLRGLAPVRNVLGLSDPDVHLLDGRWVMFLGGFTTRLRVSLFTAVLPEGSPLASDDWALVTDPGRPGHAAPLVPDPPRGAWDGKGMHAPSYVVGAGGEPRVYYAGRSSSATTGPSSRYAIGCLRRTPAGWVRHGPPVHRGTDARPSVLEPLVLHDGGLWRMWYLSAIGEVGRGELPDYQLEYVESDDGIDRWSAPQILFTTQDGYFDNAVQRVGDHYEMVVARGTNLYSTPDFPPQGLWWLRSERPSGRRGDWTEEPIRLLDTDTDALPWFANGGCAPSFHYGDTPQDRDTLYVFFTGTSAKVSWLRCAAERLARLRLPPIPSPYYLAVGRVAFPGMRGRMPR